MVGQNVRVGHALLRGGGGGKSDQLRMTHHENGERNVFEPDHYADKSFLGTHFWDLC